MNSHGDIVMHIERREAGVWIPVGDRGGASFRRLQRRGLEVLTGADHTPSVALTARELLDAEWDEVVRGDGFIPFRAHSSWDVESYMAWRRHSPRRSPETFHAGCPAGVIVSEGEAEAALAGATEEETERALLRSAGDDSSSRLYVDVSWRETHRTKNSAVLELVHTELLHDGQPDDIRLVFSSATSTVS